MKLFITLCLALSLLGFISQPALVRAQESTPPAQDSFGFGDTLKRAAGSYNPDNEVPLEDRVGSIIATVLSFLGVIFMVLMIWAGFNWMTAAGDEQKIERARNTIRAAIIGLIIVIAAYAASVFIIERLWGAQNSPQLQSGGG